MVANQTLAAASGHLLLGHPRRHLEGQSVPAGGAQRDRIARTRSVGQRDPEVLGRVRRCRAGARHGPENDPAYRPTSGRGHATCEPNTSWTAGGTLPGAPVPALGWPGTKNGETHRVWLPAAAQTLLAEMDARGACLPAQWQGHQRHKLVRPCGHLRQA